MCERCRKRVEKEVAEIHAAMDEQEVPEDSLLRGLAIVQVACDNSPILLMLMQANWPNRIALMQ